MLVHHQSFEAIQVGDSESTEQVISEEMVNRFADLSGDFSPIHMSREAALARGFQDRVVHGLLSGSLVSRVLGMLLPGEYGLLHDISLQFKNPVFINDHLKVTVTVTEKNDTFRLLILAVMITNQNEQVICKGKVTSGMSQ